MRGVKFEWFGPELEARVRRAAGRATVAVGVNIASDTKRVSHVVSGTLRRSVHTAPVDYEGGGDEAQAKSSDIPNHLHTDDHPEGPMLAVGSWLPYACVEWIGRGHPGITQGLEMNRGAKAHAIYVQAFREEGLGG